MGEGDQCEWNARHLDSESPDNESDEHDGCDECDEGNEGDECDEGSEGDDLLRGNNMLKSTIETELGDAEMV